MTRSFFWAGSFSLLLGIQAAPAFDKTEHGIVVTVGPEQVELAASREGIFRLSVSLDGVPKPAASLFLAGPEQVVPFDVVTPGQQVGIKTGAGELLIDPATGHWSFLDANGQAFLSQGVIESGYNQGKNSISLNFPLPQGRPYQAYGSGNGSRTLLKTDGNSKLGNGRAVIPYYWSDAGYAALGVSGDDDSPAKWMANVKAGFVSWQFPGRTADLYLFPAKDLYAEENLYTLLTGRPGVPPKWTFGYLQSRWGWRDKAYIDDTLKTFREKKLPVDAFIFDFESYTKTPDYSLKPEGEPNFPDFTWNPALFPNPAQQIADYGTMGIHVVPIRKPRLGDSATLQMMHTKGWILVAGKNGETGGRTDARGLNFENPDVRNWYAEHLGPMIQDGVAGWWNDEGESSYTKYYYWNEAESEALAKLKPGQRHWSVNRAFSPGLQRFGVAAWTGDIGSDWKQLALTPTNLLNWGLAGMPYGTCDIGGFSGSPTPEMLTRWMEVGTFMPVIRSHSSNGVQPHFPWLYGPDAENAIRQALDLRYRLIPFYYSLAHEAHETGAPLMRPLAMEFPDDPKVADLSDQWLMGTGLMAAPILTEGGRRTVYLPAGKWYVFNDGKPLAGGQSLDVTAALDEIPAYVRAGTIVPLGPVVQNTGELPGGPLEVRIYPGRDAVFTLVEDDGISYDYLKGVVRRTTFRWNEATRTLSWTQAGTYAGADVFKSIRAVLFDPAGKKTAEAVLGPSGSCQL